MTAIPSSRVGILPRTGAGTPGANTDRHARSGGGTVWRNEDAPPVDEAYFRRERDRETEVARQKADRYRGDRPEPDLAGKSVVVVDDGVATGSTIRACLAQVRAAGADRVVLAVPVGPPDTVAALRDLADDAVCLVTPPDFGGIGQFYERFDQVSDEEAMAYLDRS